MLRKLGLWLRGAIPLLLALIALIALPGALAWLLLGGPLGWRHLGFALLGALLLLLLGGLIFGWALGRYRGRR